MTDEARETYVQLILTRERVEKEALQAEMDFTREFGELIRDVFQMKIDCVALKKSITYCQMAANRGEEIDPLSMQEYIDSHMAAYYVQLKDLLQKVDAAKSAETISVADVNEIKKIYRRVAKKLHPDVSPLCTEHPELMEQFQKVLIAYKCNDLKTIREAETVINSILDGLGEEAFETPIEDIEAKISAVEEEISRIMSAEPYTFRTLLDDPEAVEKKRNELEEELASYTKYRDELQETLNAMLAGQIGGNE